MKTVFAYEVVLYDTDQDNRGRFFITSGLSFADNFGEAAAILESTYGEMLKSIKNLEFIHDDQNVITLPRDIIRDYIDGEKFVNEIPCDNEGQELKKMNQAGPTITGKKGLVLFHENCRHFRISPFQNLRGPLSY